MCAAFKVWKFEAFKVWKFESLKLSNFESLKVWTLTCLKVWTLNILMLWLFLQLLIFHYICQTFKYWERSANGFKVRTLKPTNFQTFKLSMFENFQTFKLSTFEMSKHSKFEISNLWCLKSFSMFGGLNVWNFQRLMFLNVWMKLSTFRSLNVWSFQTLQVWKFELWHVWKFQLWNSQTFQLSKCPKAAKCAKGARRLMYGSEARVVHGDALGWGGVGVWGGTFILHNIWIVLFVFCFLQYEGYTLLVCCSLRYRRM